MAARPSRPLPNLRPRDGAQTLHLHSPLGGGAAARIWAGEDDQKRKVIVISYADDPDPVQQELLLCRAADAEAIRSFNLQPNVLWLGRGGRRGAPPQPCLVMEHPGGWLLAEQLLRGDPPPARAALEIVEVLLQGLELAHREAIYCLDLRPDNVLLSHAGPRLLELAPSGLHGSAAMQHSQEVLFGPCSPGYTAPECRSQRPGTDRAKIDLFQVGLLLFDLLRGEAFHVQEEEAHGWALEVDRELRALARLRPSVQATLPLLSALLSWDPAQRPSLRECQRELERVRGTLPAPEQLPLRVWLERQAPPSSASFAVEVHLEPWEKQAAMVPDAAASGDSTGKQESGTKKTTVLTENEESLAKKKEEQQKQVVGLIQRLLRAWGASPALLRWTALPAMLSSLVGGGGYLTSDFWLPILNAIVPGAEICDGKDNNGNGSIDEGLATVQAWPDGDGDGFGDPTQPATPCQMAAGMVATGTDCNDRDKGVHPGAAEMCGDGIDQDCADNADGQSWFFVDRDGDGVGAQPNVLACPGSGYVFGTGDDCDDSNPRRHPGAPESCNGQDDNCDGKTDEGVVVVPEGAFCRDQIDNDCDGKTDAADPDCAMGPTPPPEPTPTTGTLVDIQLELRNPTYSSCSLGGQSRKHGQSFRLSPASYTLSCFDKDYQKNVAVGRIKVTSESYLLQCKVEGLDLHLACTLK